MQTEENCLHNDEQVKVVILSVVLVHIDNKNDWVTLYKMGNEADWI